MASHDTLLEHGNRAGARIRGISLASRRAGPACAVPPTCLADAGLRSPMLDAACTVACRRATTVGTAPVDLGKPVGSRKGEKQMPADRRAARRAVAAAVVGNVLEWYDFAVYAYMARVVAKTFFPTGDEVTSLLSTFAAFGVGFVMRPLGGILIGRLGDVRGRKAALIVTIGLMAGGTVMIGLTPSYQAIGLTAPLLVFVARLIQGFSAGGEWGTSTAFIVEWAPAHRRGLFGSLQQCSVAGGLLLGSSVAAAVSTLFPPEAVDAWAWRIPISARRPAGSRRLVLAASYRRDTGISRRRTSRMRPRAVPKFVPLRWPRAPSASRSSGPSPTISSSCTCRLSRKRTLD